MTLVLSRRTSEGVTLYLPDKRTVHVSINRVQQGRVTLSFDAPEDVKVLRDELVWRDDARSRRLPLGRPAH